MAEEDLQLEKGDGSPPRIRLSEYGTTGLRAYNGQVYEEDRKELRGLNWAREVKKLQRDAVVASGVELLQMWILRGRPEVIPYSEEQDDISKAQFIEQCMQDMEHSFDELMKDIVSFVWYGFAPVEKIYRKRLETSGSKYNDGLIGWRKLPIRSQDTIKEWKFTDDAREITHMVQDINGASAGDRLNRLLMLHHSGEIEIPMNKVLNFRYNGTRGNPHGQSPLKAAWGSWKFRTQLQMDEAVGVQRDLNGCPVMYIPAAYMSPDAKPEEKAVYQAAQNQIRNYQKNEQSGFVMPNIFDPVSKARLFSLEPLEVRGGSSHNTNEIIQRYNLEILTMLFADILVMGQSSTGSFALSGSKTNLVEMAVERRLQEIAAVFKEDLFKQTFELNGWDAKRLPTLKFSFNEDYDPDEFGKLIQRIASVEFMPRTPDTISWAMKAAGYPDYEKFAEMTQKEIDDLFPEYDGKAGSGLGTSGTGNTQSGGKSSDTNSDNAA